MQQLRVIVFLIALGLVTACTPEQRVAWDDLHGWERGTTHAAICATNKPDPYCGDSQSVEAIIADVFGPEDWRVSQALAVARCESNLSPTASSPTNDHGVFQINRPTWDAPSAWDGWQQQTGTSWANVYDARTNTEFARALYDRQGWRPWACRKVL